MKTIKKGKQINSAEFEEMSEILASIDYEAGITDSQFAALAYFADLHDVAIIEVAGIDNAQALSTYAQKKAFENQMIEKDLRKAHDLWLGNHTLCRDIQIVHTNEEEFKKNILGDFTQNEDGNYSKEDVIEIIKKTIPNEPRNAKSRLHDDVRRASVNECLKNTIGIRKERAEKIEKLMKNFNIIMASDLDPKKVH